MNFKTMFDETETLPSLSRADFPPDFAFGCSTSSFQIEGASHTDGRVESIWDRFCATPGKIRDKSNGEVACDHYHRWEQDLDLAKDMGINAYRFSVAWPRIFHDGGVYVNQQGLDFYSRLVDGMLARGLTPWLTLYHWDLPQYLQNDGGWENRATVGAYLRFVDVVTRHLGDRVKHWITHNEPWCTSMHGNWDGNHAPGQKNFKAALQVCHHVLLSHGLAIPLIKKNVPEAKVGIALSLHPLRAASNSIEDQDAMIRHDGLRNRWFLDPLHGRGYPNDILELVGADAPVVLDGDMDAIATKTDFLGVNYYFPEVIANDAEHPPLYAKVIELDDRPRTAFGWEVAPEGMGELLQRLQNEYQPAPMYITENGSTYEDEVQADGSVDDIDRREYLIRHLASLQATMSAGIKVHGYFAWSLMDNFEWAEGYARRFGLVYIDFATQQRTLKTSGHWYRQFLKNSE